MLKRTLFFMMVWLLVLHPAWCAEPVLTLDVRDGTRGNTGQPVREARMINGYARTVSGTALAYHSSHPDAKSALLVRAQQGQSAIWESDTLVEAARNGFYHLVWLAGLERRGLDTLTPHHFHLLVNGKPCVDFTNRKDSSATEWSLAGVDGAVLSFHADLEDRYGDLFGMMRLKLPKRLVERGKPVVLEVAGDDEGSADWYMTFEYHFEFSPRLRVEPALLKGTPPQQQLRISVDNLSVDRSLRVTTPGQPPLESVLKTGSNIIWLSVATVDTPTHWTIATRQNGRETRKEQITIDPVVQRDIYLLPYSHTDVGYTDLQSVVLEKHQQYIDDAFRLIEKTGNYPEDARFKWNLEVLLPLELYLRSPDNARLHHVLDIVQNGSIGLNAFYANVLTGLMTREELDRSLEYGQNFSLQNHVPIPTAVISDIPGFTWGTVDALARNGVRYFASATNPFDRIGDMLTTWGDKPFWWKSQSGKDSVLMWIPAASYATFHQGSLPNVGKEKVLELTRNLDEEGYPYRMVQLPYTLGDNAGVDTLLPDFVKQWNETYASPRLIIATHRQMFEAFDHEYGRQLPTYAGDLTPYWEDGAMSSAAETIRNRQTASRLSQAEQIWKRTLPNSFPEGDFTKAWNGAILYDEHTWGAATSIDQPDDRTVQIEWNHKSRFAINASIQANGLLEQSFQLPQSSKSHESGFDIFNTSARSRTDLVILDPKSDENFWRMSPDDVYRLMAGYSVCDATGRLLRSQQLQDGKLAVLVENVPAFGVTRVHLRPGKPLHGTSAHAAGNVLSNEFLSLEIDSLTGSIIRLDSKALGHSFADSGSGLNRLLYVSGKDMAEAGPLRDVRIGVQEKGGLVATLRVQGITAAGDTDVCMIRVVEGLNRVDIEHQLEKVPVRSKESVHIAFPFVVPDGQIRYDVAGAIVRPEKDQLPGSCKNFFSVNSWVDVSSTDYGITLATPDIPLAEFGEMTAEQPWRHEVAPGTAVFSYVMNNYWHTNFKADQQGLVAVHYSLLPHGPFNATEANAFGQDQREPLIVTPVWTRVR
jgi:hypothetical protein